MKKYSHDKQIDMAMVYVVKLLKKLNDDVTVTIEFDNESADDISGEFVGQPRNVNASAIKLLIRGIEKLKPPKQRLRRWNACVIIALLHEYSHFKIYKDMSIAEREITDQQYIDSAYYRLKDETMTWDQTVKYLKKFRYHRSKTIRSEFASFKLPPGYKAEW